MGWLQRLQHWIKSLFRPKKKRRTSPKILKRWYGEHCAILRIERDTPGGIATYRITSLHGASYLITLDYLPDLHGEMVGEFNGTTIKLGRLDHPSSPATHRLAVFRLGSNGNSNPIGIWDCDLQGCTASYSLREMAPRRAIAGVALRCLKILDSNKTPSLSWESQMERMDWLGLLEEKIRGELSNQNHSLRTCVIYEEQAE